MMALPRRLLALVRWREAMARARLMPFAPLCLCETSAQGLAQSMARGLTALSMARGLTARRV